MPLLRKKKNGMSLMEIVVVTAMISVFSLLIVSLIVSTARSYIRGRIMQDVRYQTSNVLRNMQQDTSKATLLPTRGLGANVLWIPTAILLPNPYGDGNSGQESGNGVSTDRLIFSVSPSELNEQDQINLNQNMRYIEYIVPPTARNTLLRRIYNVSTSMTGYNGYEPNPNKWYVRTAFFTTSNISSSDTIVNLQGRNDFVTFTVTRPRTPLNWSYQTNYNLNLLSIRIAITRYVNDDLSMPVRYEEQTQVKVTAK